MPETPATIPNPSAISNLPEAEETIATFTHATSPPPEYTPETHDEEAPFLSQSQPQVQAPPPPSTSTSAAQRAPAPTRPRQTNIMDNLFRFSLPQLPSSQAIRTAGVYISGALFSLGFFFFIDASVYSKVNNPGDVHIKFVDWIPGICSASAMLVINSIEKSRLNADSFSYSGGSSVAWKARLVLFLGFTLMACGLSGSIAVLVLKYIVEKYEFETMYFGVANVIANSLIMLSAIVLWVSQNMEDDYAYHLSL